MADTRRAVGRDDEGRVTDPAASRHWIGAIGYLTVVDQLGKLVDAPVAEGWRHKGQTSYERLLLWDGGVLPDEAAAIYALRCAFVHSFGLLNEPDPSKVQGERRSMLRHVFRLTAEGHDLVRLGDRRQAAECELADLPPTSVDLRTLGDVVERLVTDLRARHVDGTGLQLKKTVDLATMRSGCFFFHPP